MSFSALIIFFWYYNYIFLSWCNISPAQTFRKTQLELEVEVFFPFNTCLNAWTWCVEVVKNIFALMLYRLFSAACEEQMEGNVNLIYCWWVFYEGWLLLGFPVFQPSLLGCLKFSVLLSCSLKIYVTKLTWNYISLLPGRANGSFHAWNNFDFWCLSARLLSSSGITITTDFLNWCKISPAQTFRNTQLELEVEVFFPVKPVSTHELHVKR